MRNLLRELRALRAEVAALRAEVAELRARPPVVIPQPAYQPAGGSAPQPFIVPMAPWPAPQYPKWWPKVVCNMTPTSELSVSMGWPVPLLRPSLSHRAMSQVQGNSRQV